MTKIVVFIDQSLHKLCSQNLLIVISDFSLEATISWFLWSDTTTYIVLYLFLLLNTFSYYMESYLHSKSTDYNVLKCQTPTFMTLTFSLFSVSLSRNTRIDDDRKNKRSKYSQIAVAPEWSAVIMLNALILQYRKWTIWELLLCSQRPLWLV